MHQENHSEWVNENDNRKAVSQENANLNSRLEVYRWLLWAAIFLIAVLFVAQCAHYR